MPMVLPPSATVNPVDDAIFCQMYKQTGKWKPGSRLIIPDTAREEIFFAKVVSIGDGKIIDMDENGECYHKPAIVQPGDWIIFARYHGERVQIADELFLILREGDVLARIELQDDAEEYLIPWRIGSGEDDDKALIGAKLETTE